MIAIAAQAVQARQSRQLVVSVDAYWQLLQDTQTLVADLAGGADETAVTELAPIADQWAEITAVQYPNGDLVPLDTSILVVELRRETPDLAQLNERLITALNARDSWPQSVHNGRSVEPLTEILSNPEFQWPEEQPSLIMERLARLIKQINQFFWNLLPQGEWAMSLTPKLLNAVAIIALLLILFFSLRDFAISFVADADISANQLDEMTVLTAKTALNRAQELSQDGDYRAAVRYLYLSTLLTLEERGLLRYDRSRTNREYLRSVDQQPELAATLRDVIDVFDRVWYGFQPLDEAAYTHYADRVEDLQRQK